MQIVKNNVHVRFYMQLKLYQHLFLFSKVLAHFKFQKQIILLLPALVAKDCLIIALVDIFVANFFMNNKWPYFRYASLFFVCLNTFYKCSCLSAARKLTLSFKYCILYFLLF